MRKKVLIIEIIVTIMLATVCKFNVYALGVVSLGGSKSLSAGSSGTITVNLANGYTGQVLVKSSNPSVVSVSDGSVWCEPSGRLTIKGESEGTATITATCDHVSDSAGDSESNDVTTMKVTVKGSSSTTSTSTSKVDDGDDESKITSEGSTKKTTDDSSNKSRNNYLSSLKVSDGTLSPEFNRDITSYTINFDGENTIKNLEKIKITATADDKDAKVTGTGEKELVEGENTFSIKVKSASGSTRTYVIKVTKPTTIKESDLRLASLKVQNVDTEGNYIDANLDKEFDANTFVYSLDVENNIQSLNVEASPVSDNIDVAVTGNENLHDGMNEVVITLTSKDDETVQTTYKIIVNKKESVMLTNVEKVENFSGKDYRKESLIITSAICAIILIIIILLIIWYKKTHSDKAESSTNEEKYERNLDNNLIEEDDVIVNGNTTENSKEDIEPKNDATISNDTAIEKSKVDDETKIQTATEGLHEKTKKKDGKRKGKHF